MLTRLEVPFESDKEVIVMGDALDEFNLLPRWFPLFEQQLELQA